MKKAKQTKIICNVFVYSIAIVFMLLFSALNVYAAPQLPVGLGTAGNFVILAKTGISTTGTTAITGDVGLSPAAASYITGFALVAPPTTFTTSSLVTGKVYAADYDPPTPTIMTTVISDMEIAYTDAAGRTLPDYTELHAGDISGLTLTPGLYKWGTGVLINGGVTLDCQGNASAVFIFQIAQTLTVGNGAIITLSSGCQANNIFWQVAGQTTLGTTSDFKGIILDQTAIVLNTGATLNGRALAQTAVTLDSNAVTAPIATPPTRVLTTITILPTLVNMTVGATQQLNITTKDQFGALIVSSVSYNSINQSVATINSNGLVTAVALGNTTITVKNGTVNSTMKIIVQTTTSVVPTSTPTTSITNPGNAWKNIDYVILLNATGFNNTSIAYINYSLNNIAGQINGSFGFLAINTNGNNTLSFYAVDISGKVESTKIVYLLLDKINPAINTFILSSTSVFKGDAIIGTCVATDNSGLGAVTSITGIDTTTTGTKIATCTATDGVGNIAIVTMSYVVQTSSYSSSSSSSGGSSHRSSCSPSWECNPWSDCDLSGTQIRSCTDKRDCNTNNNKPLIIKNCIVQQSNNSEPANKITSQDNIEITKTEGNQLTSHVISDNGFRPSWWDNLIGWLSIIFRRY